MHNEYILNKAFQYWSDIGKPEYCAAGAGAGAGVWIRGVNKPGEGPYLGHLLILC